MKTLFIIPLVLMSLVSFPSWGVTWDDLVYKDGLYYVKSTNTLFTGQVDESHMKSSIENGRRTTWEWYHENGQLLEKGKVNDQGLTGYWETYYNNGQLWTSGNYKNNKREGWWFFYNQDGSVYHWTGTYKNGVKVSD